MSKQRFAGQVVWVTGASSGIGEALARAFAREGATLVLSARRREELERVAADCTNAHRVVVLPLDLADTESLQQRAREALEAVGQIDVLVHNGGISQRSRVLDADISVFQRLMQVNYLGAVALTKAVLPNMIARRRGHFVVVSSLVGVFGTPLRSGYAASKHALHGFFDSLRAEHHSDGIAVTIVCPGFIRTDVSVNALGPQGKPTGVMDETTSKGMAPDVCASRVLGAVARRSDEVYVGGRERYAVYLKRYVPGVFARFIRRANVV